MKKLILIASLFFGCAFGKPTTYMYTWVPPVQLGTLNEILRWERDNLTYTLENGDENGADYWQTPEETYNKKSGDCEDYCLLFMHFARFCGHDGFDSQLIIVDKDNGETHALVMCNGKIHETTGGKIYNKIDDYPGYIKTRKEYSYQDAMYITEKFHGDLWL